MKSFRTTSAFQTIDMSNPGVITLASLRNIGPNIRRLDVEDNIGEAIHIHWNNFRVDFSVHDFLRFSENLDVAFKSLSDGSQSEFSSFDPFFLYRMGELIFHVVGSRVESRRIGDLRALVKVNVPRLGAVMVPRKISDTPAYKFLVKESDEFIRYEQDSYPGLDNESRIKELFASIDVNGYPFDDQLITLFGNQPYIRDGQHRAAALAARYGFDYEIPIRILEFNCQSWKIKPFRGLLRSIAHSAARKLYRRVRRWL